MVMTPEELQSGLKKHERRTRQLILSEGDLTPSPVTRLFGVPWWPLGLERPACDHGHRMAFVAQLNLGDFSSSYAERLLSFHYCLTCANMSYGWGDRNQSGYSVTIHWTSERTDALGVASEFDLLPRAASFRDVVEVPLPEDIGINYDQLPEDYPTLEDDLDENLYPGLQHVAKSKIGGWPTWVQEPQWPMGPSKMEFVCQLDWLLEEQLPWSGGGYAYLFANLLAQEPRGELLIQVT